jgi:hypothetical protein
MQISWAVGERKSKEKSVLVGKRKAIPNSRQKPYHLGADYIGEKDKHIDRITVFLQKIRFYWASLLTSQTLFRKLPNTKNKHSFNL